MSPAEMDKRVRVEQRLPGLTDGEPSQTWALVDVLWAKIRAISPRDVMSARESIAAGADQAAWDHEITIRYRAGITAAMRMVCNGRVFNLGPPVNEYEQNQWLVIPATEGLNHG